MKLIETGFNKRIRARILRLNSIADYNEEIEQNFSFDWSKEESNEIYKLEDLDNSLIVGLMSISNFQKEYRLHVNLIESSILNRGTLKRIKNIPHCLLSYACKQSFALGYDGFVSLYPKTDLINYYKKEYGFEQVGRYLAVYGKTSYQLIKEYLDE